jgi:hypothetical protein
VQRNEREPKSGRKQEEEEEDIQLERGALVTRENSWSADEITQEHRRERKTQSKEEENQHIPIGSNSGKC